ncbi:MAG: hypothetical protein K8953_13685, partial [Proteobacteria bacterium]|nr:hypothetical protein [Pseudomonadota bacterium]
KNRSYRHLCIRGSRQVSGSCPPVMAGVKRVLSQLLGAYTNIFAGLQWVYAFFMFFYGFLCLFLLFYGFRQ